MKMTTNRNLRISIGRTDENLKMTEDIMKKTAVLIYNSFCNFEFSVALEILALAEKEVVIFAHTKEAVKSEDGLMVLPNQTISEINIDEYDSLILPGAMDIREAIENEEVIEYALNKYPDLRLEKINLELPNVIRGLSKYKEKIYSEEITKSIRIIPDRLRSRSCREISLAASRLILR